jgi:hypothetical protein
MDQRQTVMFDNLKYPGWYGGVEDRKVFTVQNGPELVKNGQKMAKKRNPVYLLKQTEAFQVETNEGVLNGKPGDFLAHDPISGHVWPVASSYVEQHYEQF